MIGFLTDRFKRYSSTLCMICDDEQTTYSRLLELIGECQLTLDNVGVAGGQVVALRGDFDASTVAMLLALIERRAIIVPQGLRDSASHANQLAVTHASWVICAAGRERLAVEPHHSVGNVPEFEELRRRNSPGLVLFSSGSTGKPKGVVNDLGLLLEKFKNPRRAYRVLCFLLFDHIGGLNTLFSVLSSGGTAVAISERNPSAVCHAIQQHRVQVLPTSPTFLNLLLATTSNTQWDLSSLELITYGTEPMSEVSLRRLQQRFAGVKLKQTYGLSELGILATQSKANDSLWMRLGGAGYKVRVRDGMLEVLAEAAMLGYIGAPSPFTSDGWFRTGDEVEVDGDYFRILGRRGEMINVGGQKIHPAEVEGVLEALPGVVEVCVRAEPNAITGHIVRADVVLDTAESAREFKARMHRECGHLLASYKLPQRVVLCKRTLHSERFKKERSPQAER